MNSQEQNWLNIFADLTTESVNWHGIWTRYSPELKVLQCFKCIRIFRANEDRTVVYHTNIYTYADGSQEEKTWEIEKQSCNKDDGLSHPALPAMRTLSVAPNVNTVLSKRIKIKDKFGLELFFRHEDLRTSVVVIYGEDNAIEKIVHIREHLGSYPNQPPSAEVKHIEGNWIGQKQYITPDLIISNPESLQNLVLVPQEDINKTFFLPDGIVINAPNNLKIGQEFNIIAGKFVSPSQFKRLTAQYDNSGNFQLLISEIFHQQ